MPQSQLDASVILCTYRQLESTSLALRALFAQATRWTYEVIVCDDGSDAATARAYAELLETSPVPAYLVWQQDRGFRLSASRNNGIRLSRGRILIFLDGDLVPEVDFVERHVAAHVSERMLAYGERHWREPEALPPAGSDMDEIWRTLRSEESITLTAKMKRGEEMVRHTFLGKHHPWVACFGCNISMTKSPLIEFDESFVDWGLEDYDLFYALNVIHGYETAKVSALAYDVDNRQKVWGHSDFVALLRSGIRFLDKWESTGVPAQLAVARLDLDPTTDEWGPTSLPFDGLTAKDYGEYVANVRHWLDQRGLYPTSDDRRLRDRQGTNP